MDRIFSSAAFISEAASAGLSAVASLSTFSSNQKAIDLAAEIALSATLLSETARVVAQNEAYFKPGFVLKFSKVTEKCHRNYETVLAGIEKVTSWTRDSHDAGPVRKKRWDRLVWALDGTDHLSDLFKENYCEALMLNSVVMLIILQSHAKERDLTPSERSHLIKLRKGTGKLLEALRKAGIALLAAFSLVEPLQPANRSQLLEEADHESIFEDASSTAASINICISSEKTLATSSNQVTTNDPASAANRTSEPPDADIFELYRAPSMSTFGTFQKETTYQLLGLPLKVSRRDEDLVPQFESITTSQDEIKALLSARGGIGEGAGVGPVSLDAMLSIPYDLTPAINTILSKKADGPNKPWQSHRWTIEGVFPHDPAAAAASSRSPPRRRPSWLRWPRGSSPKPRAYILILRGTPKHLSRLPPPPPPPPGHPVVTRGPGVSPRPYAHPHKQTSPPPPPPPPHLLRAGPPRPTTIAPPRPVIMPPRPVIMAPRRPAHSSSSRRSRKRHAAATLELTHAEAVGVVNDFLASVSGLYDGAGAAEAAEVRRRVLDLEADLGRGGAGGGGGDGDDDGGGFDSDCDDDGGSSSSGWSSESLVDD